MLVRFQCASRAALLSSTDVWWLRGPTAQAWGALCGDALRWNTLTDFTSRTTAMMSRDRVGVGHRKIRGSRQGGVASRVCGSGAVRPYFFQTATVKRPQWARPALTLERSWVKVERTDHMSRTYGQCCTPQATKAGEAM